MTRVSVIMPAYNAEAYVEQAIESVLAQTFTDLELIVVDDGSTDATPLIVQALERRDPRVRLLSQPNSGRPAPGRNRALRVAVGDYISFLDSDDLYLPDRVRPVVEALDAHPNWVAAFHDLLHVNGPGEVQPGTYLRDTAFVEVARDYLQPLGDGWFECTDRFFVFQSLRFAALHTQSVMVARRRLPPGLLQFDEQYFVVDDTDMWIRLGMQGPMGYLDQQLSHYRLHDTNITRNRKKLVNDSVRLHTLNYARVEPKLSAIEKEYYREKIARYLGELAYAQVRDGNMAEARASYRAALQWSWSGRRAFNYLKSMLPHGIRKTLARSAA